MEIIKLPQSLENPKNTTALPLHELCDPITGSFHAYEDTTSIEVVHGYDQSCSNEINRYEDDSDSYKDFGYHSLGSASDEENVEIQDQCCDKPENGESDEQFSGKMIEIGNAENPKVGMIFETTQKAYAFYNLEIFCVTYCPNIRARPVLDT
ncbi:hypothetical protein MKW92_006303 [Papaver armeniacum]|nr:hypothetical protein MKW92_006303 [Papaver armeniacum]